MTQPIYNINRPTKNKSNIKMDETHKLKFGFGTLQLKDLLLDTKQSIIANIKKT